ncbi:MAG: Fur family transcriptional regulator [Acidimicrobiales bacterium]
MKSPTQLTELFREQGLNVTSQRQRVFRALAESVGHPTAEEVWSDVRVDLPTVSLRTVYQTLNDLVAMGEISQLQLGSGSSRFDPNGEGHHHLICDQCGEITDIDASQIVTPQPTGDLNGFEVNKTELTFHGVCGSCRAA